MLLAARIARKSHATLALVAFACATSAQAVVTVGPHGTFQTIQSGIDAAMATGGAEVRVELKCATACAYVENVNFSTSVPIALSGGWAADFQSQIADANSLVNGSGNNAPIMSATAQGIATISISRFDLIGSGTIDINNDSTSGLVVVAIGNAIAHVSDNTIKANVIWLTSNSGRSGGAGMSVYAGGSAHVDLSGNTIQSNAVLGAHALGTFGGGVALATNSGAHIDFVDNHVLNNSLGNANGSCHGGGLSARSDSGSNMLLSGNHYVGNVQGACTNGVAGDAADIAASSPGSGINLYDEIWSGSLGSDPAAYQVVIKASDSAQILGANGLAAGGAAGGVFAMSEFGALVILSNFTVTAHPTIGFTAVGSGTAVWNTLIWNNGIDEDSQSGATFTQSISGVDPHFVDAANGNYRLAPDSPAIDTGSNLPLGGLFPTDLDGSPRPYNVTADIGAYEYHPAPDDVIYRNGFD